MRGGGESGRRPIRVEQVEQGKGDIGRVRGERVHGTAAGILRRPCLRGCARERAERAQPPLAEDTLGRLGHGGEDAADAAALVTDRAEGEGEVALLGVAAVVEEDELVLRPGRVAPREHAGEHWADDFPDLGKALHSSLPHCNRMFRADERAIGVVLVLWHGRFTALRFPGIVGAP